MALLVGLLVIAGAPKPPPLEPAQPPVVKAAPTKPPPLPPPCAKTSEELGLAEFWGVRPWTEIELYYYRQWSMQYAEAAIRE